MSIYFFILSLLLAFIFTLVVKMVAIKFKIVDNPDNKRKIHLKPIPLLGGLAVFLAFFTTIFIGHDYILSGNLTWHHWLGVLVGAIFLMIGGFLDDKYNFKPTWQLIWPVLAIISVIVGGVEIQKISNPFGNHLLLPGFVSSLFIAVWLMGMMYTTKLLDGVDGLVSGITAIAALVIFLFTATTKYLQPDISFAALVLAGAALGFLILNFNPAKIFLGEGGSLFMGYILGVLAIISGAKIAIALLVMGIPILDVAWTIIRRLVHGKNPFRFADREHLHHKLLDLGLGPKKTVLVFYALSIIFGLSGLFLQSQGKAWALLALFVIMIALVVFLNTIKKKPRLLLHTCCAPCAAYTVVEVLRQKYDVTLYFLNSNIDSQEEYDRRLDSVRILTDKYHLPLIVAPYDRSGWLKEAAGLESEPEGGRRCLSCYAARLRQTAVLAQLKRFDIFGTSLTLSPFKNSRLILDMEKKIGEELGMDFLDYDFKENDGIKKSQDFAKTLGVYRQKYCGCEFSKKK
ncbi:MAG: epoxyqueuosine reductase QueH [Candidatus Falkowbacteria bacterium]